MKATITSRVSNNMFLLNKNEEISVISSNSVKQEKIIRVDAQVPIIESIIESLVEPIIYKC